MKKIAFDLYSYVCCFEYNNHPDERSTLKIETMLQIDLEEKGGDRENLAPFDNGLFGKLNL